MEKKSSKNDISKLYDVDYVELHRKISDILGDDNIFALYSVGNGFYQWTDMRYEWKQMTAADETLQGRISAKIASHKSQMGTLLKDPKTVDALFTYPDDSYVYYREGDGEIHIMLTGWGFKKPVRVVGKSDVYKKPVSQPITVSFEYDGAKQPDFDFTLALNLQEKPFKTGSDGIYRFEKIKIGETFTLKATSNGRKYDLHIEEGKYDYVFDLTDYITVVFDAEDNGSPIIGEPINVAYNGKSYHCETDSQGCAELKLAYHKGRVIEAALRNKTESETVSPSGNRIHFVFQDEIPEPEPEPEPKPEHEPVSILIEIKDKDGNPMKCGKVRFAQGDSVLEKFLDEEGLCTLTADDFSTVKPIETEIIYDENNKETDRFSWQQEEGETHYILQERVSDKTNWWLIIGQILFALLGIVIALFGLFFVLGL